MNTKVGIELEGEKINVKVYDASEKLIVIDGNIVDELSKSFPDLSIGYNIAVWYKNFYEGINREYKRITGDPKYKKCSYSVDLDVIETIDSRVYMKDNLANKIVIREIDSVLSPTFFANMINDTIQLD